MSGFFLTMVLLLLGNLALAFVRVARGPTRADRLTGVLLTGTTIVATLVLLAGAQAQPALLDVALVLAALAAVISLSFVQLPPRDRDGEEA